MLSLRPIQTSNWLVLERKRAQDLVGPGRVLHQQDRHRPCPRAAPRSSRPARTPRRSSRAPRRVVERGPELQRERRRGDRVVDVVETGEGEGSGALALRGRDSKRAARMPSARRPGRHLRLGARAAAVRAAVAAQMAEIDGVVDVRVPAVAAVLRVGGVLEGGEGLGIVVEAEVDDAVAAAAEVGDQRVVGVQDEPGVAGGPPRRRGRPSRRRGARARRSGRAGRGRGSRADRSPAAAPPRLAAARPRRPRRGPAGPVRGRRRAAPWQLPSPCSSPPGCARWASPARSRTAAAMAADVVLPFVADTTAAPSSSRAPSARARPGRRASAGGREGGAAAAAQQAGEGSHGAGERAPEAERHAGRPRRGSAGGRGSSPARSRSGRRRRRRERAVGVHLDVAPAIDCTLGSSRCLPLNTFGMPAQE